MHDAALFAFTTEDGANFMAQHGIDAVVSDLLVKPAFNGRTTSDQKEKEVDYFIRVTKQYPTQILPGAVPHEKSSVEIHDQRFPGLGSHPVLLPEITIRSRMGS